MSDCIPLEIQSQIFKRVPIQSLFQFRSVSKQWKALIDSSEFITTYSVHQTQPQTLFVRYQNFRKIGVHCLVNSDTFAKEEFASTDDQVSHELFHLRKLIGSSHGLLCLYGYHRQPGCHPESKIVVLWNPSIRKIVRVAVHHMANALDEVVLGFGVCPITFDPTIVKITSTIPWVVEVFTMGAQSWRISSSNLHDKPIEVVWSQVAIGKFIYWVAFEKMVATGYSENSLIVSFDMTNEEFGVIYLPGSLACKCRTTLSISKLYESLAVIEDVYMNTYQVCDVWMMNHDVKKSFTKVFTVNTSYSAMRILVFTKSGEPIMEALDDYDEPAALLVYEPVSEQINDIGIYGDYGSFFVGSYMETLLLHGELDYGVYSDISI